MSIDIPDFLHTMSRVPGPVTVATTADRLGHRWGFTGSSFSSLSVTPPLVLICLDKQASTHDAFTTAEHFLVNVLAHDQADIARHFARSGVDRFATGVMQPRELGLPGLADPAARVACALHDVLDGGDHSILVGRVESAYAGERSPLVYWDRTFAQPVTDQLAGSR
ncbi:flavin reductase family protein [Streptomyces monashensis]|uniref:flavin reductase family protein n=1 Tax=Streptomyces monashensis TaxID=1678012 RepID=UPI0033CC4E4A